MSIGKVYIDDLGPLGISDSHVIFTFATKSKVKAAAILYCSLFAKFCYYLFIIMCYYQSGANYFVIGASCLRANSLVASSPATSRKTLNEQAFLNYSESLLPLKTLIPCSFLILQITGLKENTLGVLYQGRL